MIWLCLVSVSLLSCEPPEILAEYVAVQHVWTGSSSGLVQQLDLTGCQVTRKKVQNANSGCSGDLTLMNGEKMMVSYRLTNPGELMILGVRPPFPETSSGLTQVEFSAVQKAAQQELEGAWAYEVGTGNSPSRLTLRKQGTNQVLELTR